MRFGRVPFFYIHVDFTNCGVYILNFPFKLDPWSLTGAYRQRHSSEIVLWNLIMELGSNIQSYDAKKNEG